MQALAFVEPEQNAAAQFDLPEVFRQIGRLHKPSKLLQPWAPEVLGEKLAEGAKIIDLDDLLKN